MGFAFDVDNTIDTKTNIMIHATTPPIIIFFWSSLASIIISAFCAYVADCLIYSVSSNSNSHGSEPIKFVF